MKYQIYGTSSCKYCRDAKELLTDLIIPYDYYQVDTDPNFLEKYKELFPGKKTVPQIIDDEGNYVGGFDDLAEKLGAKRV